MTNMTSNFLYQIQQVSKSFHVVGADIPVLKNVTFDVTAGDFLVIFGPSGCGKSTLLHTILGLEEPTRGKVLFSGKSIYGAVTEDERADFRKQHIGMIYQQPYWVRSLTVIENVAMPLYLLGENESDSLVKAGRILRTLHMDKWINYNPSELSSGQQQKVALARAMVTDPEVIVADEPTGNLDFESGRELMQILESLNKNGQTIIMVTHDLDYIDYAKTAIRMFDGTIVGLYKSTEKDKLRKELETKRGDTTLSMAETNFQQAHLDAKDVQSVIAQVSKRDIYIESKEKISLHFSLSTLPDFVGSVKKIVGFFVLLMIYLFDKWVILRLRRVEIFKRFPKLNVFKKYSELVGKTIGSLDRHISGTISRMQLIELSIKNMKAKKTRTIITIGGMTIGIGAIVFLVSIGYGLQQLVITRVARLDEMRQADVALQAGGKVKIDDKTLSDFKDIPAVEMALPLIAVVGSVNYQGSVSDVAVYGVTTDYLKQSAVKPIQGKIFESNELTAKLPTGSGQVAGVSTEDVIGIFGEKIQDVTIVINPSEWIRVREDPSTKAKILGYTKRVEGSLYGEEVWGENYLTDEFSFEKLGKWVKSPVLLWAEQKCNSKTQGDCEDGKHMVLRGDDNSQVQKTGYFAEINLIVTEANFSQVLGITTNATNESSSALDWVEIPSEAGVVQSPDTKTVELTSDAKKQAVVNRAMLAVLGIKETESIGKKFSVSFVVVGELLSDPKEKIESSPSDYTIVGVTPEDKTPVFYVPFIDIRSLGITNYSQVKVVVKDQSELSKVRRQIESMGYATRSVADTVEQINTLFSTIKTVLALLGMVALSVAALGMFNTLTVSLLERTREVGLLKAMGMKSSEVQDLFLTESMIMGFFSGILGIAIGFITGKLAGLTLSFFTLFKGVGFVDISYIPFSFIIAIIFLSLLVGIVTGIYPARRATKISALNALRYE